VGGSPKNNTVVVLRVGRVKRGVEELEKRGKKLFERDVER